MSDVQAGLSLMAYIQVVNFVTYLLVCQLLFFLAFCNCATRALDNMLH